MSSFFDKITRFTKKYPTATDSAISGGGLLGILQGFRTDNLGPGESSQTGPNQIGAKAPGLPTGLILLGAGAVVLVFVLFRRKR